MLKTHFKRQMQTFSFIEPYPGNTFSGIVSDLYTTRKRIIQIYCPFLIHLSPNVGYFAHISHTLFVLLSYCVLFTKIQPECTNLSWWSTYFGANRWMLVEVRGKKGKQIWNLNRDNWNLIHYWIFNKCSTSQLFLYC